jgi:TonB family protein
MAVAHTFAGERVEAGGPGLELAGAVLGAVFTFGLFMGISHFETKDPSEQPVDIVEMRAVSIPMDAPPPRPVEASAVANTSSPLAGLEVAPSESDVKIAVVPPDLEQFIPATKAAPAAAIEVSQLFTEFRPTMDLAPDFSRVFQQSEVDKIPTVLSRPLPIIPSHVRGGASTLRVVMLLLVDQNGSVRSVRVIDSSGNPEFDAIIARDAQEAWLFTPAIKKGKRVRCLVQQTTRVNWSGSATPFEN